MEGTELSGFSLTIFQVLQFLSFFLCGATILVVIKKIKLKIDTWLFELPILTMSMHGFIYYFCVLITKYIFLDFREYFSFTTWSSALRFHGYAAIFIIAIASYIQSRRRGIVKWN